MCVFIENNKKIKKKKQKSNNNRFDKKEDFINVCFPLQHFSFYFYQMSGFLFHLLQTSEEFPISFLLFTFKHLFLSFTRQYYYIVLSSVYI